MREREKREETEEKGTDLIDCKQEEIGWGARRTEEQKRRRKRLEEEEE